MPSVRRTAPERDWVFPTRRTTLALLPALLAAAKANAKDTLPRFNPRLRILNHAQAVAEGQRRGIGSATALSPQLGQPLTAASHATFLFRYVAGTTPIEAGGYVSFAMRHVFHATPPQTTDPQGAGYVTVQGPPGAELDAYVWPIRNDLWGDLFLQLFPWQHTIEVRVKSGRLMPGEAVVLTYGDCTGGGPGMRLQPCQERDFAFRVYVSANRDEQVLPLADDLAFPIIGGPVERLALLGPSTVDAGKPVEFKIRAEDVFGNQASGYEGALTLSGEDGRELRRVKMTESDEGVARVEVAPTKSSGVMRFSISDGTRSARSNPVRIVDRQGSGRVFFGDIHGHTLASDGRGTPDQFYAYCRNVAGLDFCALTEHDFMLSDDAWKALQEDTERHHVPGKFVTLHAYEWSGMTDVGGDHNVYFRGTDTPLMRCRSYYDYRNQQMYHGGEPQVNFIEDLYAALLKRFAAGEVMVIPHWGGRHANPAWHNPQLERLIEIFSDHQRSHDWAYTFLKRGYKLGIMASNDSHLGRPGYGFLKNPLTATNPPLEIGTSLVAVLADELTREGVFDALYQRRAYATTGGRILLDVAMGEACMGQEVTGGTPPPLTIAVEGTAPIKTIEFWKDGAVAHTVLRYYGANATDANQPVSRLDRLGQARP